MTFEFQKTALTQQTHLYRLFRDTRPVSYDTVLKLWESDSEFILWFSQQLAQSPFEAFRWETPVLTQETRNRDFECVLVDAPRFVTRRTHRDAFSQYFNQELVVSFPNLSGDGLMIVPCPTIEEDIYGHLASVLRHAPEDQIIALWKEVGARARQSLNDRPKWLNTAGGGVAWLHVRLDSRPKYYHYMPYQNANYV